MEPNGTNPHPHISFGTANQFRCLADLDLGLPLAVQDETLVLGTPPAHIRVEMVK